jgi:hypothetical protein
VFDHVPGKLSGKEELAVSQARSGALRAMRVVLWRLPAWFDGH